MIKTHNAGNQYENFSDASLEFFSKAGSIAPKVRFYQDNTDLNKLWFSIANDDPLLAMKLLFWVRDPRKGAGNRSRFREILQKAADTDNIRPWILANIANVPEYGRYDDLHSLHCSSLSNEAADFIIKNITDRLCAKWMPRKGNTFSWIRDHMGITNKELRQILVANTDVVENLMCDKQWDRILYKRVPSIASVRYANAFKRNDEKRYNDFLQDKESKMNASVTFPHELWRIMKAGEEPTNKLFESLPDFPSFQDIECVPMIDVSGSMTWITVSGNITPYHVATGMGLYLSDRNDGPMHRVYLTFESTPSLITWRDNTPYKELSAMSRRRVGGSTNVQAGLNQILDAKIAGNADKTKQTMLLILSDMQFNAAAGLSESRCRSIVEASIERWADNGFPRPVVVYWNLAAYEGQPGTGKNAAFVSGFNTVVLRTILETMNVEDGFISMNPMRVLEESIKHYNVIEP